MTGARCPVCDADDLAVSMRAASCNLCGYCWPVEQLSLPVDVDHAPAADPARPSTSPLVELRERSARTRWRASGQAGAP